MKSIFLILVIIETSFTDIYSVQQESFAKCMSDEYRLDSLSDHQIGEVSLLPCPIEQNEGIEIDSSNSNQTGEIISFDNQSEQQTEYSANNFFLRFGQKIAKFLRIGFHWGDYIRKKFDCLISMNTSVSDSCNLLEVLEQSGMIRMTDNKGMSLLMYAAIYDSCDTANWIISHIDPSHLVGYLALNDYHRQYTVLHWAVYCGNSNMVALLLNTIQNIELSKDVGKIKDIFINAGNKSNITPLYLAFYNNYLHIATMLIYAGADVNIKSGCFEETPIYLPISRLPVSAYDTVDLLIRMGAKVNVLDIENKTPLHLAALYGCFDITKLLLESVKTPEERKYYIYSQDIYGYTAFHLAIVYNRFPIATLLLKNLENVVERLDYIRLPNYEGLTAFHSATIRRNHDATEFITRTIKELYLENTDSKIQETTKPETKKIVQDPR